ncbi:S-methyl-5-thioribose kinase [Lysinibacter cavernae]|uniref:S-methyl-5-thioribose kinase n=1 Tax=Lysinibacter cavernae TaxID=1640652 RepID=A0A7X5R1J2_9MICO|nr:S-methyl-5-thioribose kinase [Lysinibacter cavernae]NIH53914.1 5-methylthioribose kinase [Lysinibacter cavernae]
MTNEMLTVESVATYINTREPLTGLIDTTSMTVAEVGDGNLNQVFLCEDDAGRKLVLKQALPYVRLVGPAWPMTVDRAAREAHALTTHSALAPELVCRVIDYNPDEYVLALEDLSDHEVFRTRLNAGGDHAGVFEAVSRLTAKVLFGTSWLALGEEGFRLQAAETTNSELCLITEELVLTEPYVGGERNSVHPTIKGLVSELQADDAWIAAAMQMKRRFLTCQEALVHGDLHTGSIFVRGTENSADFSVRAFDSEFAFYGPIGLDLGLLWANIIAAAARASALGEDDRATSLLQTIEPSWNAFVAELRALWPSRVKPAEYPDAFLESWLASILDDALGFAGAECCRRIIGLAKLSDIESLPEDRYAAGAGVVLRVGRSLLINRSARELSTYLDEFNAERAANV